jgi:hypothetical protein
MIHEVLARPAPASAPAASGALAIRDLHKSFTIGGAPRAVLEGINLDIRAAGRVRQHRRCVGLRQIDLAAADRRTG